MGVLSIFALICLGGIFQSAGAQPIRFETYNITSDTAAYIVLPASKRQIMIDSVGNLSFNQVLHSNHFQNNIQKVNYQFHVYWMRFRLLNTMPKDIKIAFPEKAAQVDLYTRLNDGRWNHAITGSMVGWNKRNGLKRTNAFVLSIPPGSTLTVYKRMAWNYVAFQPDTLSAYFTPAERLIMQNYVKDDSFLMTSLQDAIMVALFILTMIISFYFFLVVREKEFLYFSLYLLIAALQAIPSLGDAFLREYPKLLLYLYVFCNSFMAFGLIHFLRYFLRTFDHFPIWDKILIIFSFLQVIVLLASHFASSLFQVNLSTSAHFSFNLSNVVSGIIVLITLSLYLRKHEKAIRLMIVALTPILLLKVLVYTIYVTNHLYSPKFGVPTLHGYVFSFNKTAFLILIVTFLWMIVFFNRILFLRFSTIRKELFQQITLDHLKSRFFANISHEFRTPLTLIIGPLEDMMQGENPEKFTALVPEMHRNSERLLQLINQLLDLSLLDTGNYNINTTREDIIPFVRQIVHSFFSLAERRNITLETEVDSTLRNTLNKQNNFYFDEDIIEKVLTNLLSNAFKFTPDGGHIFVGLRLHENKQSFLELKVEDNGAGISEEKTAYIFDRFYQADRSMKKQHEGSGIGLSLVKELVELHKGTISVNSEVDRGTIFTCLFPFNQKIKTALSEAKSSRQEFQKTIFSETEEQATEKELSVQQNGKPLILVVEDQRDVRKYIGLKLEDTYTVMEAGSGKKGLEIALERVPDLVISDVMMPEMDGFELCKKLKTEDLTSHIPVILLTARAEDSDKMAGLETGADAYLIKPFNSQELRIRVKNLILLRNKMRAKFSGRLIVKPRDITVTSVDRQFMQKLLSTVEEHIDDPLFSVDQLAEKMNVSPSQLYRKLKALINQSTQQFIRSVRMERAIKLLKEDTGTVSEIAWKVGFEDPGYFSKVFKKYFGCLPSEKDKFPE